MDLVLRAVVVFFLIFVVTRVVGRRELGKLEPFDLIMLIVLGNLVQQGVTQSDNSLTGTFLVIGVICILTVGVSYLGFRLPALRPILGGEPLILIENGEVIERNLRSQRLSVEEVASQARLQQIAHLSDVRWAVLETSGDISFIPKKS